MCVCGCMDLGVSLLEDTKVSCAVFVSFICFPTDCVCINSMHVEKYILFFSFENEKFFAAENTGHVMIFLLLYGMLLMLAQSAGLLRTVLLFC